MCGSGICQHWTLQFFQLDFYTKKIRTYSTLGAPMWIGPPSSHIVWLCGSILFSNIRGSLSSWSCYRRQRKRHEITAGKLVKQWHTYTWSAVDLMHMALRWHCGIFCGEAMLRRRVALGVRWSFVRVYSAALSCFQCTNIVNPHGINAFPCVVECFRSKRMGRCT